MSARRHLYGLAATLVCVGAALIVYRAAILGFPLTPGEMTETWRIEARARFHGGDGPIKLELALPQNTPSLTVLEPGFVAAGLGLSTTSVDSNRYAVFSSATAPGPKTVYFRALVHRARTREEPAAAPVPAMRSAGLGDTELAAGRALLQSVQRDAADVDTLVRLLIARLKSPQPQREAAILLGREADAMKLAEVAVRVLRLANIPARRVNGIALAKDGPVTAFHPWIEIYADERWQAVDLDSGEFRAPSGYLPWWYGIGPIARLRGGTALKVDLTVQKSFDLTLHSALTAARNKHAVLAGLSIYDLPIQTQEVYKTLLVLPVGILLLVVLRNVVGLTTFGTFMPVLIAVAFSETGLLWGLGMFLIVLAGGLLVRFYLEQLKLLVVPRVASVVLVVVMIMVALGVMANRLGIEQGLSVALFPIVILSMTIERMTIVWDERGAREALKQAVGSMAAAVACYLVMSVALVRHIFFMFPEALLFLLALTLMLGRYSGYRLVELPRFAALGRRAQ